METVALMKNTIMTILESRRTNGQFNLRLTQSIDFNKQ